jgi:uncharacterized protein (TIGR03083 family)
MPRQTYQHAMEFFVTTASQVGDDQWDLPGLGEWTVRDLVGHTARAMLTVQQFTSRDATLIAEVPSSVAYYQRAFAGEGTNARVAERGRQTAQSLGPDLPSAVARLASEVSALIDALPDDHIFASLIGGITLVDYLPTRTVELVVHTLDLQAATGIKGEPPRDAMLSTLHLLAELAVDTPNAGHLALLATGRDAWVGPFSVIG